MPARFSQVHDNLYRGGEPSSDDLAMLKDLGIKKIISLDEEIGDRIAPECEKLEFEHIIFPLTDGNGPNVDKIPDEIEQWDKSVPTYVHCKHGKDRTSAVCAIYRIKNDKWSLKDALKEASEFGMGEELPVDVGNSYYDIVRNYAEEHKFGKDKNEIIDDAVSIVQNNQDWSNPVPGINNYQESSFQQQSFAPFLDGDKDYLNRPAALNPQIIRMAALQLNTDDNIIKVAGVIAKIKNWWKAFNDPVYKSKINSLKESSSNIKYLLSILGENIDSLQQAISDSDVPAYERSLSVVKDYSMQLAKDLSGLEKEAEEATAVVPVEMKEVEVDSPEIEWVTKDYKKDTDLLSKIRKQLPKELDVPIGQSINQPISSFNWFKQFTPDNIFFTSTVETGLVETLAKLFSRDMPYDDAKKLVETNKKAIFDNLKNAILTNGFIYSYDNPMVSKEIGNRPVNQMYIRAATYNVQIPGTPYVVDFPFLTMTDLMASVRRTKTLRLIATKNVRLSPASGIIAPTKEQLEQAIPYKKSEIINELNYLISQAENVIYKHTDESDLIKDDQIWFLKPEDDNIDNKQLYSANIQPNAKIVEISQEPEPTLIEQALHQEPDIILFNSPVKKQFFIVNPGVLVNIEKAEDVHSSNDIPINGIPLNGQYDNYSGLAQFVYPGSGGVLPGGTAGFSQLSYMLPGNI